MKTTGRAWVDVALTIMEGLITLGYLLVVWWPEREPWWRALAMKGRAAWWTPAAMLETMRHMAIHRRAAARSMKERIVQ